MSTEQSVISQSSATVNKHTIAARKCTSETQIATSTIIQSDLQVGTDSVGNCSCAEESEPIACGNDDEKSLEFGTKLTEMGIKALKENDYGEAAECFSQALEIRVSHYGELAFECLHAYYQYGHALLYKAQEEADPLAAVPKEAESDMVSDNDECVNNPLDTESLTTSSSLNNAGNRSSISQEIVSYDAFGKIDDQQADVDDSDDEDSAGVDEDESDLDLAWKMLDVARALAEKYLPDSMVKVDILSALAEVALEREDIDTSLADYQEALSILERLVEPDSRYIAELNFRICLCLEIGSKPNEAISYCQKAISICKSLIQKHSRDVHNSPETLSSSAVAQLGDSTQNLPNGCQYDKLKSEKESEIQTLAGLSVELEKKLEDLQQLAANPKLLLSELLEMACSQARGGLKSGTQVNSMQIEMHTIGRDFSHSTPSTVHTSKSGVVTHLGVVGRGAKHVLLATDSVVLSPTKKPMLDASLEKEGTGSCL